MYKIGLNEKTTCKGKLSDLLKRSIDLCKKAKYFPIGGTDLCFEIIKITVARRDKKNCQ